MAVPTEQREGIFLAPPDGADHGGDGNSSCVSECACACESGSGSASESGSGSKGEV